MHRTVKCKKCTSPLKIYPKNTASVKSNFRNFFFNLFHNFSEYFMLHTTCTIHFSDNSKSLKCKIVSILYNYEVIIMK